MDVGMSTACFFPDYHTEDIIALMPPMGVNTIEVFLNSVSEYTEDFCAILADRIAENNLKVNSFHVLTHHFEPDLFSVSKRQREDAFKTLNAVLSGAVRMGAEMYTFHGTPIRRDLPPTVNYKRIAPYVDDFADVCLQKGIKLAWENVNWAYYNSPEFVPKLLNETKSDNIYFTFDIKQAKRSGIDPYLYLNEIGDRLVNVHLCDYDDEGNLFLPGEGSFDFNKLYEWLKKADYDGAVIMEVYRNAYSDFEHLKKGVDYLKNVLKSH